MLAREAAGANTVVVADAVQTCRSVLTRERCAVVRVDGAVLALVSPGAEARVRALRVDAGRLVVAGRRHRALVHVALAQRARPPDRALARELRVRRLRHAPPAVTTLVRHARVEGVFAVSSGVWGGADAAVPVHQVDARAAVQTRVAGAVVDVRLAVHAGKSKNTVAFVSVQSIMTSAAVLTRVRAALIYIAFTTLSSVTRKAVAYELVDAILAGAAIGARIRRTLVNIGQASSIVVSSWTFASESVNSIDTFAAISARI